MPDKKTLRARDFWASITLFFTTLFFLWKTTDIPFTDQINAGGWYNSAALVPAVLLIVLLVLSVILLMISVRDGGAAVALSLIGVGLEKKELARVVTLGCILFFYIVALVPRVDFIIGSALVILAMIVGYHRASEQRMWLACAMVSAAGLYALVQHFPQSQWNKPHDDDLVALGCWVVMAITLCWFIRRGKGNVMVATIMPCLLSLLIPLMLVCAMAFGFKQNVPNRGGLLFSVIEYHYYVNIKPRLSS
ncbi:MAG: hypothetical protein AAF404_00695 [Pseudomonadota bacterium]